MARLLYTLLAVATAFGAYLGAHHVKRFRRAILALDRDPNARETFWFFWSYCAALGAGLIYFYA